MVDTSGVCVATSQFDSFFFGGGNLQPPPSLALFLLGFLSAKLTPKVSMVRGEPPKRLRYSVGCPSTTKGRGATEKRLAHFLQRKGKEAERGWSICLFKLEAWGGIVLGPAPNLHESNPFVGSPIWRPTQTVVSGSQHRVRGYASDISRLPAKNTWQRNRE